MSESTRIDPRAIVAPTAKLGQGVEVGPFAIIGPDVEIGDGTIVGPHAVVTGWTKLGSHNRIFQFASIGDAPQDKKYAGEPTRVEIGDRNVFREYVTVNRGTTHDKGITRVGSDNLFMASSHIAHDCIVGSHCVFANLATLGGHVEVDDHVILAGFTGVHQFCKIGAHAFIADEFCTDITTAVDDLEKTFGQARGFEPGKRCSTKSTWRAASS